MVQEHSVSVNKLVEVSCIPDRAHTGRCRSSRFGKTPTVIFVPEANVWLELYVSKEFSVIKTEYEKDIGEMKDSMQEMIDEGMGDTAIPAQGFRMSFDQFIIFQAVTLLPR